MYNSADLNSTIVLSLLRNSERDNKYKEYLTSHINGVQQAYEECFKGKLNDVLSEEEISNLENNIKNHDKSKYTESEWTPYIDFFYPEEGKTSEDARKEFDYACLHHYHHNPHHWNHWILNDDENKENDKVLDMDLIYIIEMLCDWHSFSLKNPESTAFSWWEKNKENMNMTDNTIELVNKYIQYVNKPLNKK